MVVHRCEALQVGVGSSGPWYGIGVRPTALRMSSSHRKCKGQRSECRFVIEVYLPEREWDSRIRRRRCRCVLGPRRVEKVEVERDSLAYRHGVVHNILTFNVTTAQPSS